MIVTSCSPSSAAAAVETSRFPKLDECAHFHYDVVDLGPLTVRLFWAARLVLFCLFGAHSRQTDGRTDDRRGPVVNLRQLSFLALSSQWASRKIENRL
jgi:hypothetical protein